MTIARVVAFGWIIGVVLASDVSSQNETPRNYALLIGINEYQSSMEGVQNLNFAVNDAEVFGKLLEDRGYTTIPLRASLVRRETIVQELASLARRLREQDFLLVYFAGHGVQWKNGTNSHIYWLTYDTTLAALDVNALRVDHILDYIADIPARRKLVVLDHCHSGQVIPRAGPASAGDRDVAGELIVERGVFPVTDFRSRAEARVSEGLVILGAARDKAYEDVRLKHGIFTQVLINALSTPEADDDDDGRLSVLELMKFLEPKVQALAESTHILQQPVQVVRGQNIDWDLGAVGSGVRELQRLLARLELDGSLNVERKIRCIVAIDKVEQARASGREPDSTELKIVQQLQQISQIGDGLSWSSKAEILEAFLDVAAGGNP